MSRAGYRENKLLDMVASHDVRLRSVAGLARRSGAAGTSAQRIAVQLTSLLLVKRCCNTRDVHLLRGVQVTDRHIDRDTAGAVMLHTNDPAPRLSFLVCL